MTSKEKQIIEKYFLPLAKNKESFNLSTDGALINQNIVVSSDMMIENVHFKKNHNPKKLAQKLLRVNLSDLAAMGSKPFGYTLNVAIPKTNKTWLKQFSEGLKIDSKKFRIKLFGGDLSRSEKICLSVTIFGKKEKLIHSSSKANLNSEIFVSGYIGDAAVGYNLMYNLKQIKCNLNQRNYFYNKFFLPEPQIKKSLKLLGKVDFCTDISDSLFSELEAISNNSNLQSVVYVDLIPLSPTLKEILKTNDHDNIMQIILGGGEDYQLLFSTDPKTSHALKKIKGFSKIGYFSKGSGVKLMQSKSKKKHLKINSFSHF